MPSQPTTLELSANGQLEIQWSDNVRRAYAISELRDACPCATCREKRRQAPPEPSMLPILSAAEAQPLRILGMKPVGSYAYSIAFSDGHDTGIFTFELLRQLGKVVDS